MAVVATVANRALVQLGEALQDADYRFTTVTPLTHQRVNARSGNAEAKTLRDIFGWSRPFSPERLHEPMRNWLDEAGMLETDNGQCHSRVRWSSLAGRLFVHSRYPTDEQDAVFFGPDTYRFIQALQAHLASEPRAILRIADIGCGAGPGAIIAALARPAADVWALDINRLALQFTEVNAAVARVKNLRIAQSNLLNEVLGEFDLIISNPPYMLDAEQRAYRHGGGSHGAALSVAIVEQALSRLAPGGTLLLYTGVAMFDGNDPFLQAIEPYLASNAFDWQYREVDPDVFGEELLKPAYAEAERIAAVVLRITRRLTRLNI